MIIWRGLGFLTLIFTMVSFIIVEHVVGVKYYRANRWTDIFAFFLAGALSYFIGRALNKNKGKVYIDKETGKEILVKNTHSFFFIRMEYWGFILPVIGVIYLIASK